MVEYMQELMNSRCIFFVTGVMRRSVMATEVLAPIMHMQKAK